MKAGLVALSLVLVMVAVPGAAAEPDPPECYDRQPIVDAGVLEVWLTRGCSVRVVVDDAPLCNDVFCV